MVDLFFSGHRFLTFLHGDVQLQFLSSQLEITEGTPDLGVTSYWTDADGNVVFGPNTPKEKMKTPVTGTKIRKRKGEWANM